jgi:hypothetical protein
MVDEGFKRYDKPTMLVAVGFDGEKKMIGRYALEPFRHCFL